MTTVALWMIVSQVQAQSPGIEVFRDAQFRHGFQLTAASHPAPMVEIGVLEVGESTSSAPPEWRIAQWGTRTLLEPGCCTRNANGVWIAENAAKHVEVERAVNGMTRLWLEVRGAHEYAGKFRATGESWPHLLIEQGFSKPIRPAAAQRMPFSLDMRVAFCKMTGEPAYKLDPGLHTAQVSAYWTVQDMVSSEHDMIWFGIPLFDARYDVPPAHYAIDGGKADASGKFICVLDGKRFWSGSTGDGAWRSLDLDLIPLLREALAIAQQQGHLKLAKFEDLAITSFNLGWEVPGPYDAAIEFRRLSLKEDK